MSEVLKKFGRYFLLDRVAQGGMAEIYRARLAAKEGASRLLVIKRIQGSFGENPEFIKMFQAEIKVTMGFNHPNIVQLYDFGEEQNQPYIAMEFVDGRNLRQFLSRFAELKQGFPFDLASYIIEQAASGLQYAHGYKDKISGEPLNIVHRDISPQNILISYEGNIKVIDFGIAKAANSGENTRAGVIKGKPSYLSPEQISGDPLDGRCDIFALGIVYWELLTGRKLFAGENDLAVLKLIDSCNTTVKPPSAINPEVPKELDYVVLKALTKSREKRYQTAEEFRRAIHKFIYGFNPDFNPADLSYFARDLFKDEIVEDRKRIQKLNEKAEILLESEFRALETTKSTNIRTRLPTKQLEPNRASTQLVTTPLAAVGSGVALSSSSVAQVGASTTGVQITQSRPAPKRRSETASFDGLGSLRVPPTQQASGQSGFVGWLFKFCLVAGGGIGGLVYYGPSVGIPVPNVLWTLLDRAPAATPDSANGGEGVTPTPAPAAPVAAAAAPIPNDGMIALMLKVMPGIQGATIQLNGHTVRAVASTPIRVGIGQSLQLSINRPGFKPLVRDFVVDAARARGLREWPVEVALEPEQFGYLSIHSTPSADAVLIAAEPARQPGAWASNSGAGGSVSGVPWNRRTPFEREKVPVGTYNVKLTNEVLGMEKVITVTVKEGKVATIDERLEVKD